jgi:hypothetical protein
MGLYQICQTELPAAFDRDQMAMIRDAPPAILNCTEPFEFRAQSVCWMNTLYHVNVWVAMGFSVLIFLVYSALIMHICFRIRNHAKHMGILLMAVGYLLTAVLYFLCAGFESKFMTLGGFENAVKK